MMLWKCFLQYFLTSRRGVKGRELKKDLIQINFRVFEQDAFAFVIEAKKKF